MKWSEAKAQIEFGLKLFATMIAAFGVWKYFADRDLAVATAAQERSLSYIARFGADDVIATRGDLMEFWTQYPEFIGYIRNASISERSYRNFVAAAYPNHNDKAAMDAALFRMKALFDEVAFCRAAGICDAEILDGFFCDFIVQHARVYGPFYDILSQQVGSDPTDANLRQLAETCAEQADS